MFRTITLIIAFSAVSLTVGNAQSKPSDPSTIRPAKAVVTYAPKPHIPEEALAKHLTGAGVCFLHLRSDGSDALAEMIQSTGQPLLDKATIDCFSKWRFVPGTTQKIKIPINYTRTDTMVPNI